MSTNEAQQDPPTLPDGVLFAALLVLWPAAWVTAQVSSAVRAIVSTVRSWR